MVNTRKIGISIRFYPALMEKIDELAELKFQGNVTETISSLTTDGLRLRQLEQNMEEHPEKAPEMFKELTEKIKNESIFEWIDTLDPRQQKAFVEHIKLNTD